MKSITSKISIITLILAAMTFTFVLGTASSKARGDDEAFQNCVAQISTDLFNTSLYPKNIYAVGVGDAVHQIISCAK